MFRMCDSVRDQEELKNLLISDIKGKNNRLGQIRPLIGSIREAAQPLLDILSKIVFVFLISFIDFRPEENRRDNTGKQSPISIAPKRAQVDVSLLRRLQ